jgi:hypothetical protein
MQLKTELLTTLTNLGITEAELPVLYDRMMSLVTNLQASINALTSQIDTLSTQKAELETQLVASQAIAAKLLDQP